MLIRGVGEAYLQLLLSFLKVIERKKLTHYDKYRAILGDMGDTASEPCDVLEPC